MEVVGWFWECWEVMYLKYSLLKGFWVFWIFSNVFYGGCIDGFGSFGLVLVVVGNLGMVGDVGL